jgi:hypothetical protein
MRLGWHEQHQRQQQYEQQELQQHDCWLVQHAIEALQARSGSDALASVPCM